MSTIQLTGALKLPINGSPASNAVIRLTSISGGIDDLMSKVEANYQCDSNGNYDFILAYGRYRLDVRFSNEFIYQGDGYVNENTKNPSTLSEFLESTTPPTDKNILYFNEIKQETDDNLEQTKTLAAQAQTSANLAEQAEASARKITGIDTVEQVIDQSVGDAFTQLAQAFNNGADQINSIGT